MGLFCVRSVIVLDPALVLGIVFPSAVFAGFSWSCVPVIIPIGFVAEVVRSVVPVSVRISGSFVVGAAPVVSIFVPELIVRPVIPDSIGWPGLFVI